MVLTIEITTHTKIRPGLSRKMLSATLMNKVYFANKLNKVI